MEIIISSNSSKPIYEQITSQIKAMIMEGTLQTGDPIPSMRSLAKSLHISVITVQKAYEDLQRDGFIETTVGRGSFVSACNRDFILEEQQRQAVVLRYCYGLSLDQTAARMGTTRATAMTAEQKGLRLLRHPKNRELRQYA